MTTIDKVAWLRIERGRVLCVRSHGSDAFYLPGGKREPGESDAACLLREIGEELGVRLLPETLREAGVYRAQAHGKADGTLVRLACYEGGYAGRLRACAEIAQLAWLAHADRDRCSAAAVVVLDALREGGRIV